MRKVKETYQEGGRTWVVLRMVGKKREKYIKNGRKKRALGGKQNKYKKHGSIKDQKGKQGEAYQTLNKKQTIKITSIYKLQKNIHTLPEQ